MDEKLKDSLQRLKDEQKRLLLAAADINGLPPTSTLARIAQLELNIAAVENGIEDGTLAGERVSGA